MIDITFSINRYDEDGDICRAGIYLHFGETSVRVSDDISGLKGVAIQIQAIIDEIEGNY